MRRILATSIAMAIPAMLPMHAADAHARPAPPPASGTHAKPAPPSTAGTQNAPAPGTDNQGTHNQPANGTHDGSAAGTHKKSKHQSRTGTHEKRAPRSTAGNTGAMVLPREVKEAIGGLTLPPAAGKVRGFAHRPQNASDSAPSNGATRLALKATIGSAAARSATLTCDPVGGTHPKAAEACADLAKSHGNVRQQPNSKNPRACFMIYAPVTVSAEGEWRGESVHFSAKFPNTCVMHAQTGSIFDF